MLSPTALPRHSLLHNLVEFLEQAQLGGNGERATAPIERLQSFTRPPTQYEQIEHIKTVSSLRSLSSRHHPALQESQETLRRSRQAQRRVEQMRRAYGLGPTPSPEAKSFLKSGRTSEREKIENHDEMAEPNDEMNEMEREAFELYQWSQDLSFEDIG